MKKQGIIKILIGVVIGLVIAFLLRPANGLVENSIMESQLITTFTCIILGGLCGAFVQYLLDKRNRNKAKVSKLRTAISVCLKYILFKQKLVVIMIILGLILGFTVRPVDSLTKTKATFADTMNRGAELKKQDNIIGYDLAVKSLNTMVLCGVLGALLGGLSAFGMTKIKKRSLSEERMKRLTKKRTRFSFLDYLNYRVLWLTIEQSIEDKEIGDIIGILGVMFISSIIPCMIINWILGIGFTQMLGIWMLVTFIYYSIVDSVKKVYRLA